MERVSSAKVAKYLAVHGQEYLEHLRVADRSGQDECRKSKGGHKSLIVSAGDVLKCLEIGSTTNEGREGLHGISINDNLPCSVHAPPTTASNPQLSCLFGPPLQQRPKRGF